VDDRWRSVQEIAEYLGVSTDSVYRWVEQRGLPVHRVGRLLRFKCSEVDEWVHRQDEDNGEQDANKPGVRRQKTQPQKRASARR
jgi:excisionase family DNA binding protein